jgi:hypothetical protein
MTQVPSALNQKPSKLCTLPTVVEGTALGESDSLARKTDGERFFRK